MDLDKLIAGLAFKRTKETKQIRIDRTGLNQDRKMKMLKKFESHYVQKDHIGAFYKTFRGNRK